MGHVGRISMRIAIHLHRSLLRRQCETGQNGRVHTGSVVVRGSNPFSSTRLIRRLPSRFHPLLLGWVNARNSLTTSVKRSGSSTYGMWPAPSKM